MIPANICTDCQNPNYGPDACCPDCDKVRTAQDVEVYKRTSKARRRLDNLLKSAPEELINHIIEFVEWRMECADEEACKLTQRED